MPILHRCRNCRTLIAETQTHCANCTGNTSWNGTRDRTAQATFRKLVLYAAGHRCQHTDSHGRCPETTALQAHHTEPGNHDPRTGQALCRAHHRAVDPRAR